MSVSDKKLKASPISKVPIGVKEIKEMKKMLKTYKLQVESLESENKSLSKVLSERKHQIKYFKSQINPEEKLRHRIEPHQANSPNARLDLAKKNQIVAEESIDVLDFFKKSKQSSTCKNLAAQVTTDDLFEFLTPKKIKLPKKVPSKVNKVAQLKALSKQNTSYSSKSFKNNEKFGSSEHSVLVTQTKSEFKDRKNLFSYEKIRKNGKKNREGLVAVSANNERIPGVQRHREDFIENLRENVELFTELIQERPDDIETSQEWFVEIISKYLMKYTHRVFGSLT